MLCHLLRTKFTSSETFFVLRLKFNMKKIQAPDAQSNRLVKKVPEPMDIHVERNLSV